MMGALELEVLHVPRLPREEPWILDAKDGVAKDRTGHHPRVPEPFGPIAGGRDLRRKTLFPCLAGPALIRGSRSAEPSHVGEDARPDPEVSAPQANVEQAQVACAWC